MILFSYLAEMLVKNHVYIRLIMLHHFVKGWNTPQSFRDLTSFFGEETIAKSQAEGGSGTLNPVKQAS